MGANDRTVQHLRLRAPSAQAAVRATRRLEDALRCASLPDAGERVLLVRRLHLGRLPAGLSSQSVSLLIEQRVEAVGGEWVQGGDERAAHSNTVFFASRLQAAQAAVRWRAQGAMLNAWYWPLALPGVDVLAPAPAFLAQLVGALEQQPAAPLLLREWVADAVHTGAADWLVQHMQAPTTQRVMAGAGACEDPGPGKPVKAMSDPHGRVHALPNQGAAWLPAVLRAARWQALPHTPFSLPIAPEFAPASAPASRPASAPPHGPPGGSAANGGETPPTARTAAAPAERHRQSSANTQPLAASADHRAAPGSTSARQHMSRVPRGAQRACALGDDDLPTSAGGLLFLLPVLDRLGFADWQAQHNDATLAAAVLQAALRRLRVPADDPAWALVASLPQTPAEVRVWTVPPNWRDARMGVAHDLALTLSPEKMAALWLKAVRRFLRHFARIGLASLCLRAAHVRWSRTHLDVRFAPCDADVRVRRAMLDLDPGWLPWLDRVVFVHYRSTPPP